jgi:hypothetical protein
MRAVSIPGKVIDQTERRVFKKESVPASEKVISFLAVFIKPLEYAVLYIRGYAEFRNI